MAVNKVSKLGEGDDDRVAANEVGRGDDGWGWLLTTYVAWALTDVLAANKVSKVGEMTMGVAAHHIRGMGAVLVYAATLPGCKGG